MATGAVGTADGGRGERIMNTIHKAARDGDLDALGAYVAKGVDVNARTPVGFTPLHELCMVLGEAKVAEFFVAHGAHVGARDARGRTPLHYAAGTGHEGVIRLLLDNHADVNVQDHWGETPLHWAALSGHREVVELLLASHAKPDRKDRHGETPLAWAAYEGHSEIVSILMRAVKQEWRHPPYRHVRPSLRRSSPASAGPQLPAS